MEGEIKLGFGDIPKKGIFGPTREEAAKLNASPGKKEKGRGKWLDKALLGATAATGALTGATPTITRPPEVFAEQPPAIETPDQRGPSPAEVQGIVIPPLREAAHTTVQPTTSKDQIVALERPKQPEKRQFESMGFSEQENKVLKEYYDRAINYFHTRYGPDIFQVRIGPKPTNIADRKIVFRKIDLSAKSGHGLYTEVQFPPGDNDSVIEIHVTTIFNNDGKVIGKTLRDIGHEMSHFLATQNIATGIDENSQIRLMYKPLHEGLAELDAYNLDEGKDPMGFYDIGYFKSEEGKKYRQDPKFATQGWPPNGYRTLENGRLQSEYYILAAAISELEGAYPGLPRTMVDTFKKNNRTNPGTGQKFSPGMQWILDEIDRHYTEQGSPGFKEALAKEPALRYQPPQPLSPP